MAKLSSKFQIPDHIYSRLIQDGATEITPEVVSHKNAFSGKTEHEIVIRAKFNDRADSIESGCPRPCPFVHEDMG